MKILSLLTLLALSNLAQAAELPIVSVSPILNGDAHGDEVKIVAGGFTPHFMAGGFGNFLTGVEVHLIVSVKELAYNKEFRVRRGGEPQYLSFEKGEIAYRGRDSDDRGLYEMKFMGGDHFDLEVMMPARFNEIPDLNHPVPGWNGPIFGVNNVISAPIEFPR